MNIAENQRCHIRWMIRKDFAQVIDIEAENFEFPWDEDNFIRCLRPRIGCTYWTSPWQNSINGKVSAG